VARCGVVADGEQSRSASGAKFGSDFDLDFDGFDDGLAGRRGAARSRGGRGFFHFLVSLSAGLIPTYLCREDKKVISSKWSDH